MKIVRDYPTSQEIGYIVNAMLEKETALEREVVKVALVAQLVCEEIGDFNDCNDIYDMVVANNAIDLSKIVNNYDIIDKIVSEELGVNNIIKDFINNINEKLDTAIKDMDLNGAITQLKEISDKNDTKPKSVRGGKNGKSTK